jgi:hypothetical protein
MPARASASLPAVQEYVASTMTPEQLDAAFFTELFGTPIHGVHRSRIGAGLIGMNVRCELEHDNPAAPRSVVVKLPSPDETSRATGIALGNYEREVRFYNELADTLTIRRPQCHFAEWDGASGDFVIVLDDLSPAEPGDQIDGTTPQVAALVLHEAAALHSSRWNDPALHQLGWLQRRTPDDAARVVAMYQMLWPGFASRFGPNLTSEQLALGERIGSGLSDWIANRGEPWCITHGDFRLDNMLFGHVDGAEAVWTVDWQTPGHGPALSDVSYFMGAGLTTVDRRRHERALLDVYLNALGKGGVQLDVDECWEHYGRESIAGVVVTVVASMVTGETDRSHALFTTMAQRHLTHVADCAAL